jgi:cellobiose-specific phosphotransferase system component IIA
MGAAAETSGVEHPFTLRSTNNVSEILREWAEAKQNEADHDADEAQMLLTDAHELQERALSYREELLGY